MTFEEAKLWASQHDQCMGFTFMHASKEPLETVRIWFKTKLEICYNESWWSYSLGRDCK